MKQSAVSRIEQASYSGWTFKTLLRVADALDAQVKVSFEAADDVIERYAHEKGEGENDTVGEPPVRPEASGAAFAKPSTTSVHKAVLE